MPPSFQSVPNFGQTHLRVFGLRVMADATVKVSALSQKAISHPLTGKASAAIGSFDGVHLGHANVIQAARHDQTAPSIICFDPHPQAYLRSLRQKPDDVLAEPNLGFRLMHVTQQLRAFESIGVDQVFILSFDAPLSALSPDHFASLILRDTLGLSAIACGFDFTFGARGAGKAADLSLLGEGLGFTTQVIDCQYGEDGEKLSSTRVREALIEGDCLSAHRILGRPQAFEGIVIQGDQKGRTIGFPTANMALGDYQRPKYGVYATKTRLMDGRLIDSVSNLGIRPTIGGREERFETHLIDFDDDLYGQVIEVSLMHYLRAEQKMESFEALKAQIALDVKAARSYFAEN